MVEPVENLKKNAEGQQKTSYYFSDRLRGLQ